MKYFLFHFILALFVGQPQILIGQNFLVNGGALSFGIADANVCLSDGFAPINNIAGIAEASSSQFSLSAKVLYEGTDLSSQYLTGLFPLKKFTVSAGILNHGNSFFNQQKIGIGIANRIGFMKMGFQINYLQIKAEGFGSMGNLVLDFGGIAELSEKLTFGAHIFNITQSGFDHEETIPVIMKAGINYSPTANFATFLEVEKEIYSEPLFKAGIRYEIITSFFVSTGVTINPTKNFFGVMYEGKRVGFGYSFSFHQVLGMIHQASLYIKLNNL